MTDTTHSWQYRRACIESHVDRLYGARFVDRTPGGQAEHYGFPKRSVGIEWSWHHNTWFCGWELRNGAQTSGSMARLAFRVLALIRTRGRAANGQDGRETGG